MKRAIVFILCGIFFYSFYSRAETIIETDSLALKIDAVFKEWDAPHSPGGAIAIVKDSELIFIKGYGCADLEHSVGVTPSTKFYMASISKQFVGYCVAGLIHDGKLTLNDDLRKYIPETPSFQRTIKVGDLVYQKSGLRDLYGLLPLTGFHLNGHVANADVLKIFSKQEGLNFLPGDEWEYSNTNYLLLAEIIKRITGESVKNWAEKVIFGPLNMKSTFFVDSIETLIPGRANSYHQNKDGSFSNDPFLDVTVGHTGLYSTAEDMAKWQTPQPRMGRTFAFLAAHGVQYPQPGPGQDNERGRAGGKIHDPSAPFAGAALL
ncbi:MAG TPA: serine hydrolase domain-containing protein [Candidatus Desulfaltia sp.]|nr:serine hydrolase domain-containing protein [Candidatus Desulfaltia sp.]